MTSAHRARRRAVLLAVAMALAFAGALGALLRDDSSPRPSQRPAVPEREGPLPAPWSEPPGAAPARALPASEAPPPSGAGEPSPGDAALSSGADGPTRRVTLSGRLMLEGADGAPAPREVVAGWASERGAGKVTGEVAPDGTFSLELEASRVAQGRHADQLLVGAAATRGWSCPLERVTPGQGDIVVLAIRATAALRGTVLDWAGKPVAGATVRLSVLESALRSVTTDAAGSFVVDELPPDLYRVHAWAIDVGEAVASVVVGPAGRADVVVTLEARRRLTVTLCGPDGAPLGGRVVVRSGSARTFEQSDPTSGAVFTFVDLPPGPLDVTAIGPPDGPPLGGRARLTDETEVELRLAPAARLEGVVSTSRSTPPRQVVVRATDPTGGLTLTTRLDAAGRFSLVVPPGHVDVDVVRTNNQPLARATNVEVPPGVTTRLDLATTRATLRLRIVPPPPAGGLAVVWAEDERVGSRWITPAGDGELDDLLAGPVRVVLRCDDLAGVTTAHLTADAVTEAVLELRPAARARVRLVDARGRPLRGAAIDVAGPAPVERLTTDHAGEATIGGLLDGVWTFAVLGEALPRLAARLGVSRLAVPPVEVRLRGEREVEVVLRALAP